MTIGAFILGFIAGGTTVCALLIGIAYLGHIAALRDQYNDGHY